MPLTDSPLRRRCRAALVAHRRRAKADRQAIDWTLYDLEARAQGQPCCAYCGAHLTVGTLAFDHRIPPCRRLDDRSYALVNLAVCCTPCNQAKGLLTDSEYQELLCMLARWGPRAVSDLLGRLRSGGRRYAGKGRSTSKRMGAGRSSD